MQNVKITDASDDQIRAFAISLQLDEDGAVSKAKTRADLLAVLGPAWSMDHILADEPEAERGDATTPVAQISLDTGRDDGPMVKFKIMQTDMPGGKHPASPCVNGRMLVMQRGMLIEAPYAYFLVLENAKVGVVEQGADERGADGGMRPGALTPTEVTNYPLSEVVRPPQSEIDAWHARNGGRLLAA